MFKNFKFSKTANLATLTQTSLGDSFRFSIYAWLLSLVGCSISSNLLLRLPMRCAQLQLQQQKSVLPRSGVQWSTGP